MVTSGGVGRDAAGGGTQGVLHTEGLSKTEGQREAGSVWKWSPVARDIHSLHAALRSLHKGY